MTDKVQHKDNVTEPIEVPKHRIRFLIINPASFVQMFTKGFVLAKRMKIVKGVPEDAKLVRMTVDHVRGGIILVVESDTYDEIPMNEMPPVEYVEIDLGVRNATKKKSK